MRADGARLRHFVVVMCRDHLPKSTVTTTIMIMTTITATAATATATATAYVSRSDSGSRDSAVRITDTVLLRSWVVQESLWCLQCL